MKQILFIVFILLIQFSYAGNDAIVNDLQNQITDLKTEVKQVKDNLEKSKVVKSEQELKNKIEAVSKDTYSKEYELRGKHLNVIMWLAGIIISILSLITVIAGIYYYHISIKKYKQEVASFKEVANLEVADYKKKMQNKFNAFQRKLTQDFNTATVHFFYQRGVEYYNKREFALTKSFFELLYKGKEYKYSDVCYFMAACELQIGGFDIDKKNKIKSTLNDNEKGIVNNALKYLKEAQDNTTDKMKLRAIEKLIGKISLN